MTADQAPGQSTFALRPFEPEDASELARIHDAAVRRNREPRNPAPVDAHCMTQDAFCVHYAGKPIWVCVDVNSDASVGYAAASDLGALFWLNELSVHPINEQRGATCLLLNAVITHARWRHHTALGLSTCRHATTNAPFYQEMGFVRVDTDHLPENVKQQVLRECPPGIDPTERCVMVRKL